jgi:hypothetical protein
MIFERSMELLTQVQPRIFSKLNPVKVVELFKLGEEQPSKMGIRCCDIVSGFYSFLGFTRLTSKEIIQTAVSRGVQEGVFGYFTGSVPTLDAGGKYQVTRSKVRFDVPIAADEVDLESGFVMLPQAIPLASQPAVCPKCGKSTCECEVPPAPCLRCGQTPCVCKLPPAVCPQCGITPCICKTPPPPLEKVVELHFTANRDQLFTAWNAIANLADIAGAVSVNVRAESEKGFDKGKLQNGVMEPLRESGLIE